MFRFIAVEPIVDACADPQLFNIIVVRKVGAVLSRIINIDDTRRKLLLLLSALMSEEGCCYMCLRSHRVVETLPPLCQRFCRLYGGFWSHLNFHCRSCNYLYDLQNHMRHLWWDGDLFRVIVQLHAKRSKK